MPRLSSLSWSLLVSLPLFLGGCLEIDGGMLTMAIQGGPFYADGASAHEVEICSSVTDPADQVEVVVSASTGTFELADADSNGRAITLLLLDEATCDRATWRPGTEVGTVRFEAAIGEERFASETVSLSPAIIAEVRPTVSSPFLSDSGMTMLNIGAELVASTGGGASDGTLVHLSIEAVDPPTSLAVLSDNLYRVGQEGLPTLYVAPGTDSVRVRARVEQSEDPVQVEGCVTAVRPGSSPPASGC